MKKIFATLSIIALFVLTPGRPARALSCDCVDGRGQEVLSCDDCIAFCGSVEQIRSPAECRVSPAEPPPAPTGLDCECILEEGSGCSNSPGSAADCEQCALMCGGGTSRRDCIASPAYCQTEPARAGAGVGRPPPGRLSQIPQASGPASVPFCWTREQCAEDVCRGVNKLTSEGGCFETGDDRVCTGIFGRCYPPDQPYDLQIKIGDKVSVQNLKDYIGTIWNFAAGVAGTLAVVMLIWGGIQWMISGAVDQISKAKETMRNALVGLILVLGSYVLLNTINPALTELALPRVAALRQVTLGSNWCADLPRDAAGAYRYKVADAGRYKLGPYKTLEQATAAGFTQEPHTTNCNEAYYIQNAGQSTCLGRVCDMGKICLFHGNRDQYGCDTAQIGGEVSYSSRRYATWFNLVLVCARPENRENTIYLESHFIDNPSLDTPANPETGKQSYRGNIAVDPNEVTSRFRCARDVTPKFLMLVQLNDQGTATQAFESGGRVVGETLGTGAVSEVSGRIIGSLAEQDDDILLGKSGCSNGRPFRGAEFSVDAYTGKTEYDLPALQNLDPSEFWSLDEVLSTIRGEHPIRCDIDSARMPTD